MSVDAFGNWEIAIILWKSSMESKCVVISDASLWLYSIFGLCIFDDGISTLFNYHSLICFLVFFFIICSCPSAYKFKLIWNGVGFKFWLGTVSEAHTQRELMRLMALKVCLRLHVARHLWPEFLTNCNYIMRLCPTNFCARCHPRLYSFQKFSIYMQHSLALHLNAELKRTNSAYLLPLSVVYLAHKWIFYTSIWIALFPCSRAHNGRLCVLYCGATVVVVHLKDFKFFITNAWSAFPPSIVLSGAQCASHSSYSREIPMKSRNHFIIKLKYN